MLQRLKQTQFQIQQSALLAMSLGQLEDTVRDALNDNPALEKASEAELAAHPGPDGSADEAEPSPGDGMEDRPGESDDGIGEAERASDPDSIDTPDDTSDIMEVYGSRQNESFDAEAQRSLFGETQSLRDKIREQTIEMELSPRDRYVLDYLIDSIDDDGMLHDDLGNIADTLAIYHGIDTTTGDIDRLLKLIQQLDPPGVGARSLKECLLIQAQRHKDSPRKLRLTELIEKHFGDLCQNNWERIRQQMGLNVAEAVALQKELQRLNPRPGSSMGESGSATLEQIVPDFTVDVADDGKISLTLNKGNVPRLTIADSFIDIIEKSRDTDRKLSRREQDALVYARDKVQAGKSLIAAIERRWQMLHDTMMAIIKIQHRFFTDGDDASIVPMTLKDVAERVGGVSLSSVSRVSNEKYVDTPWGIFPLKHFFTQATNVGREGEAVSHKTVVETLKDIVAAENPASPWIDDELVGLMRESGFECSRRTIAKYRALLGIPTAKMRRKQ